MGLFKINRIVREFSLGATGAKNVITLEPQTLSMSGGNLYTTPATANAAYLIDIKAIRVCGTQTSDGAFRRSIGFAFEGSNAANTKVLVTPTWAQQAGDPATYQDYVAALTLDIRATGRTTDDAAAVADKLNIITTEVATSSFPAIYKLFIDIYGFGQG